MNRFNMSKEEYLRYTHQSILMMTNNCDTKASFLLAILGIIVSVFVSLEPLHMFIRKIITDYSLAFSGIDWLITLNMICYLFSAIGIIIIFFLLLKTLVARLQSNNPSLLFFGTIADMSESVFEERVDNEDNLYSDFKQQIYTCSCICAQKYRFYNTAVLMTKITMSLLVISVILTLINYYKLF